MAYAGNQEGHSITRPPMFNGTDYTYWKTRMRIFLISMDFVLVIGAQQANHVSDGTCDLIQNLFAYYILAYITL